MFKIINSSNLDEVINMNMIISDEIDIYVLDITRRHNKSGLSSHEKLSFDILNRNNLIQTVFDDKHFGGVIITKDKLKIPIINTAQPRVYQYFVAWHEIYHLFYDEEQMDYNHNINIDLNYNERKADYFAACMMLGNIYEYFFSIEDENFIDKIIKCMNAYKAPYKAVLIQLYQDSKIKYNNIKLQKSILEHFDLDLNLIEEFERLELDVELVKPSYVINFGGLDKIIERQIEENPDETYHKDNLGFLKKLREKAQKIKEEITNDN